MKRIAVALIGLAIATPIVAALLRRKPDQPAPIDEICQVCHRDLTVGDAFEERVADAGLGEAPDTQVFGGGTYMTAYYCGQHRTEGAVASLG